MCLRINLHFLKMINNFYLRMLTKYVLLKCFKKTLLSELQWLHMSKGNR